MTKFYSTPAAAATAYVSDNGAGSELDAVAVIVGDDGRFAIVSEGDGINCEVFQLIEPGASDWINEAMAKNNAIGNMTITLCESDILEGDAVEAIEDDLIEWAKRTYNAESVTVIFKDYGIARNGVDVEFKYSEYQESARPDISDIMYKVYDLIENIEV